ncbi:MAG: peptidoglycan DD-metalloendopeptidase family protein, partial [Parcubacteria group bacterium]|nr:peptidoglycan DD-metalloendopeptidase family protein [Parcubacteria group bacterium]
THKKTLESKAKELSLLELDIEQKKLILESEAEAKRILIEQTEKDEARFQQLITQAKLAQESILEEIKNIEADIARRLAERKIEFQWDPNNMKLIWPVPNQGIVTLFHDEEYPFRRIVGEHSGLDLRTLIDGRPSNGVPVRAAAPGIVIKIIRDGRFVGNAVYVAHSNQAMTVYLHLSRIEVQEDQTVEAGEVIASSGGMPGTRGAGLSTGPHLHFEMRMNGIPVDPLPYLP